MELPQKNGIQSMNELHSDRLRLVPATADLIAMERRNLAELTSALKCAVHPQWPPESVRDVLERFETILRKRPEEIGWHSWYWITSEPQGATLVGNGGFRGPPDNSGIVEIGYSTLEPFQGRGFATEAVGALVRHVLAHTAVTQVIAEYDASNFASVRVLLKNGFVEIGNVGSACGRRFRKELKGT
jgi:RimJ/RimL family protein N-acetyltransferase